MSLYTYKPLLTQVQNACLQLNLIKPTGVFDTEDENANIMGSLANNIGPMLQDIWPWQQFQKQLSIIGDGIETAFDLPPDFSRFTSDTGWSLAKRRPVTIINQAQYAAIKAWLSQSFYVNPACLIQGDQLTFLTPPADQEEITFAYISKFWVIDGTDPLILKEEVTTNADTPMHDSVLFTLAIKTKWMETRGLNTAGAQQDFNERFKQITTRNDMANSLSLNGGTMTGFRYLDNVYNSPDTNLGA